MVRAALQVREARREDMPMLLELWSQLREQLPRRVLRNGVTETPTTAENRFEELLATPRLRLVVAESDEEIIGMAVLRPGPNSALVDLPTLEFSHVCVKAGNRHRGVGKALLGAAVAYADELGIEQVVASVFPAHREANRFYARLGFAPIAVRRVAPVALLRRQLAPTGQEGRAAALRREIRLPRRRAHTSRSAQVTRDVQINRSASS